MMGWVGVDLEVKGVWNAPQAHIPFQLPRGMGAMIYDATMVEIEAGSTGGHMIKCAPYHRGWFNSTHNELFV
jgi:hypothetical protein